VTRLGGTGRRGRGGAAGRDDRGQIVPLAAAMVALCCAALMALVPVAGVLDDRARARTAADAAALAGAADGDRAARQMAEANGGDLVEIRRTGDEVVVQVRVGGVEAYARARATRRPAPLGPAGPDGGAGGHRAGLAPAMLAALARADGLLGRPVTVASGLRTHAQQEALWERRATNPYPVARPGPSDHERGLAIDVPRGEVDDVLRVASAAGLCQPLPVSDPIHFIVCGA
jgi:D-alanyl-D-alanine carboxypeptidase/Putative Flp pilus-assembly TadE/G-like